jgi:hypothetical protein
VGCLLLRRRRKFVVASTFERATTIELFLAWRFKDAWPFKDWITEAWCDPTGAALSAVTARSLAKIGSILDAAAGWREKEVQF